MFFSHTTKTVCVCLCVSVCVCVCLILSESLPKPRPRMKPLPQRRAVSVHEDALRDHAPMLAEGEVLASSSLPPLSSPSCPSGLMSSALLSPELLFCSTSTSVSVICFVYNHRITVPIGNVAVSRGK